jgi:hypothetical protein
MEKILDWYLKKIPHLVLLNSYIPLLYNYFVYLLVVMICLRNLIKSNHL